MLPHQVRSNLEDRARQSPVIARFAGDYATPLPQTGEIFLAISRSRYLGVRSAEACQGVGITPSDRDFAGERREIGRMLVRPLQHLAVSRLNGGKAAGELFEIAVRSGTRQAGKNMIHAEEQALFVQIRQQRRRIVAAPLKLEMVPFFDRVHAHVEMRAAAGGTAHFFAQKEVLVLPQWFDRVNRIVIGHGYQVHPTPLQRFVDLERIVIAFPADSVQHGNRAHAGMDGVNVQIALHAPFLTKDCYNCGSCGKNIGYIFCFLAWRAENVCAPAFPRYFSSSVLSIRAKSTITSPSTTSENPGSTLNARICPPTLRYCRTNTRSEERRVGKECRSR